MDCEVVISLYRKIEKPRIVLLDCNLEYKKGESQVGLNCRLIGAVGGRIM